jgi:hypothetical protein
VLGVPASLTGIGLFALFLLAEDLAHGIRHLAIVDPLTGLLNRRGFDEAARRVKAQCRRSGMPVCVAVADLDNFKSINDRFGHKAGDMVLSEFARRLRANVRAGDLVSRAGVRSSCCCCPASIWMRWGSAQPPARGAGRGGAAYRAGAGHAHRQLRRGGDRRA